MPIRFAFAVVSFAVFMGACSSGGRYALDVASPDTPSLAEFDHAHARWTTLLTRHAKPGGVDYAGFATDRALFDEYLGAVQGVSPGDLAAWTDDQRFAFWINVYNAHVIRLVADNLPLCSIKDLGTVPFCSIFDKQVIPMAAHHPYGENRKLSLNDIEHEILRAEFEDARLHAAVNCASKSCPPLLNEAFVAERLDAQLEQVMRRFVNDRSRNRLNRRRKTLHLSKIFEWFEGDFIRDAGSVQKFVARFADADAAGGDTTWISTAAVGHLPYSWDLNHAR